MPKILVVFFPKTKIHKNAVKVIKLLGQTFKLRDRERESEAEKIMNEMAHQQLQPTINHQCVYIKKTI